MLIECLIKREGPTHINIHGFPYVFDKNEHGHYVCEVVSDSHANYLMRTSGKYYRPYSSPETDQVPDPSAVGLESGPVSPEAIDHKANMAAEPESETKDANEPTPTEPEEPPKLTPEEQAVQDEIKRIKFMNGSAFKRYIEKKRPLGDLHPDHLKAICDKFRKQFPDETLKIIEDD